MMNFTETYTTDHYIFNYHKDSAAEKEIAAIADTQEECFAEITKQLDVSFPMKIEYFLCNSVEEVGMYLEEKLHKSLSEINLMFKEYIRKADLDEESRNEISNLLQER